MHRWTLLALLLVATLTGCDNKPAPRKPAGPEVDVAGRAVDPGGEPLAGYALRFQLDPPDKNHRTWLSLVQKDGKFQGNLLPGRYRVTLVQPPKDKQDKDAPAVKPQYWELTVPPGGKKTFVLEATE